MPGAWEPLLCRIAVPRLPGSAALADVEDLLVAELRALGYDVTATRFTATSEPLDAAGALGSGSVWIALLLALLLFLPVPAWSVPLVLCPAVAALALVSAGLAHGRLGAARHRGTVRNVEGRRGTPRVWLVAHSDSKAQPLSLGGRVVAAVLSGIGGACLVGSVVVRVVLGPLPWAAALVVALPLLVGGALLSRSAPSDDSPGAVDNASGMIAVLAAAEALADRADVGILVTGGEEFGMRGARVWVAEDPRGSAFVNVDGIDSRGAFRVMVHGQTKLRRAAAALAGAVAAELGRAGSAVHTGRLPPGVFVDGAVLAGAGMPGVTVSRGNWSTLSVIHTRRDAPERLDPKVAVSAGRAVARAVRDWLG